VLVAKVLPTGFIPTDDTGQIFAFTEAAQDVSFNEMVKHQQAAAAIVAKHPGVEAFMSAIGGGPTSSPSKQGRIFMRLNPREERAPAAQIVQELRQQLSVIPGLRVYPQMLPPIRLGGSLTKALYQFTLFGSDLNELYAAAQKMETRMR